MFANRTGVRAGAAVVVALVLTATPSAALAGGVYFVKPGDTLSRIGRLFGVGVDDIRAANPLAGDKLEPGDRLRIPDLATPAFAKLEAAGDHPGEAPRHGIDPERVRQALCREETVYHAVLKGETLTAIARRYQTTVGDLQKLNNLRSRSRLSIGQRIVVRKSGPRTHVVRKGETLTRIAARTGVPVDELRRRNGMESDALAIGRRLIVEPCDPLASAGSAPPPLGVAGNDEFLAAVAESTFLASQEAGEVLAASRTPDGEAAATLSQRVIELARTMLNVPYRFGGTTLRGIDCSAYVQRVFGLVDLALPRTAREQFRHGERVDRPALSVGDLVFFRTYASFPSHVGIYLGDDLFIHASSLGRRVTINSLEQGYYRKRFLGGRRVIDDPGTSLAAAP